MSAEAIKQNVNLLNSILLAFVVLVMGIMANATIENGKRLAALTAGQVTRDELKMQYAELNKELGVKYLELRQRQDALSAELVLMRIDIVRLQNTKP